MPQRRVENTRVNFWTFSPVSVKDNKVSVLDSESLKILRVQNFLGHDIFEALKKLLGYTFQL